MGRHHDHPHRARWGSRALPVVAVVGSVGLGSALIADNAPLPPRSLILSPQGLIPPGPSSRPGPGAGEPSLPTLDRGADGSTVNSLHPRPPISATRPTAVEQAVPAVGVAGGLGVRGADRGVAGAHSGPPATRTDSGAKQVGTNRVEVNEVEVNEVEPAGSPSRGSAGSGSGFPGSVRADTGGDGANVTAPGPVEQTATPAAGSGTGGQPGPRPPSSGGGLLLAVPHLLENVTSDDGSTPTGTAAVSVLTFG